MRLIDVDAFKNDYRMANECKDCQTPVRTCEYDRVYTKMDFCEWLDSASTVQPVQRWIPCSEKLPESIKPVIITWRNNDPKSYYQYIVGKPFIGTGHYCKGKWFWYSSTCEDLLAEYGRSDVDEVDEAIEVIAWMPLPEAYREE